MLTSVLKANPYHDKQGRFTHGPGGKSGVTPSSAITPKMESAIASARDEVLSYQDGKEHSVVVAPDGRPFFAKDGDETSISFTDDEMAMFGRCVMVHNHPSGGSLSIQDILFSAAANLAAVEAVSDNGVYRATPTAGILDKNTHGYVFQIHELANNVFESYIGINVSMGVISPRDANLLHVDLVMESLSDLGLFKYERKSESPYVKAIREFPGDARTGMKQSFFKTLTESLSLAPDEVKKDLASRRLFDEKIVPNTVFE
jgi:hypothetical protein